MNSSLILKNIRKSPTFELIKKQPSFLRGVVSVLGIRANIEEKYNISQTDQEADSKAVHADWKAVGADLKKSISIYESTQSTK